MKYPKFSMRHCMQKLAISQGKFHRVINYSFLEQMQKHVKAQQGGCVFVSKDFFLTGVCICF